VLPSLAFIIVLYLLTWQQKLRFSRFFSIINFFEFHRQLAEACKLAANDSGTSSIGFIDSPLSSSFTPSLFHSRLKTFLFCKSFPP